MRAQTHGAVLSIGISIPTRITFEGFANADKNLELCAEFTDEIVHQMTVDLDDSDTENE